MAEQGRQGHPPSAVATTSTPWGGCPSPKWGLGGVGPRRGALRAEGFSAAHLVVRGHQVLYRLAICCGDLLDVGGFLLPGPSQL